MKLRRLLVVAFALAAAVLGASSALRLAGNGIGCTPWPACYGQSATASAANETTLATTLRLVHRVAASAFALVAVVLVAIGWRGWNRAARAAAIALLAVTIGLAALGRYTPSPLPAVTLANVLGGFALLAFAAYLLMVNQRGPAAGIAAPAIVLIAALALQVGSGALISARLAGDACVPDCTTAWLPGAAALANPFVAGTANEMLSNPNGGQSLVALHRLGGLLLALVAFCAAHALRRRGGRWAIAAMLAAAATAALGFATASVEPALATAVLHALAAALLVATLGAAASNRLHREATP